jgi:hypothetical protein
MENDSRFASKNPSDEAGWNLRMVHRIDDGLGALWRHTSQ